MGRPLKTKVSETSVANVVAVIDRVSKKLKTFTRNTLQEAVNKSFQKTENDAEVDILDEAVLSRLAEYESNGKYTVVNGTYTVVAGKRGRPKKVVEAVTAV
jgi:uncharacterized protein YuzB (UPF0349 family)